MKESEMRKDMNVLISSTNMTRNTHTSTRIMESMVDKIYKIKYITNSRYGKAAIIDGYYWHPNDLTLPKPLSTEKPKIQHFDVKELMT